MKVDPSPGTDSNFIYPSNFVTIYSDITRPSPIPLVFIYAVSLMNPNSLKSLLYSLYGIPIPVSITETSRNLASSSSRICTLTITLPFYVNFSALD